MPPADDPTILWRLRGHGRDVRCVRHGEGHALELRVLWGKQLFLTETFDDESSLARRAGEIRASLQARGWQAPEDDGGSIQAAGDDDGADAIIGLPADARPGEMLGEGALEAPADLSRRPTVLIVDGEETRRAALRRDLELAGYAICEAGDIEAGLDALGRSPVDAVVLELHAPDPTAWGRSGLEILGFVRLHAASAAIPVLVVADRRPTPEEQELIKRQRADLFPWAEANRALLERLDQLTGRREFNRLES